MPATRLCAAGSLGLTLPVVLTADEGAVGIGCGGDPDRALRRPCLCRSRCRTSCTAATGVTARGCGPGATVHTTGVGVTAGGDPNVSAVRGMDVAAARGRRGRGAVARQGDPVAAAMS